MNKRVLVIGGNGFTGRHFIEAAKAQGLECVALCRESSEFFAGPDKCVAGDITKSGTLRDAVASTKPDYIVHLAAVSFVGHDDVAEIYQANLIGTLNLLEAVTSEHPDVSKVLIASSANVYGNQQSLPIDESTPPAPVNHYANSKLAVESLVNLYPQLPVIVSRPFNYTGRGQHPNFVVPKLVNAYREKKPGIQLGNLDVSRDFSDVRDVVSAYLQLLDSDTSNETVNICSGKATSLAEILAMLNELAGYQMNVESVDSLKRGNEIITLYGSPAKLESIVGNYRRFSIRDTLDWMLR